MTHTNIECTSILENRHQRWERASVADLAMRAFFLADARAERR